MTKTLSIDVPEGMSQRDAEILLRDALSNFVALRTADDYLDRQYPRSCFDERSREEKREEIARRVKFAKALHWNLSK